MSILFLLLTPQIAPAMDRPLSACRPAQLRLSLDGRDGDFNGMSHAGTELSLRNVGPDCSLPALPKIELRDARGHILPAGRAAPVGMHPGPVMVPVRLRGGHRAATVLRWVSGPVYPHNRSVTTASVTVQLGTATLQAPLVATLYGPLGKPVIFDQAPLRPAEGITAG